ncbi:MAG: 6-phosphofructokinase [Planctomycetaceae bacterium]|nr:6-phosphofructokinase [Planctomycetaceae bacterium]
MKRIGILTAGGDTPALNATIYGAVVRANQLRIDVFGIIKGFSGMINPAMPHVHLNPLFSTIPELNPCLGGTLLGASRTYIDPDDQPTINAVAARLDKLGIDGVICIGGDGTINGMQPLAQCFPTVLAPKTIDNDLGLNYAEEANEWLREPGSQPGKFKYRKLDGRPDINLEEMINYVTPGFATAVYVAATGIQRIRTTAESHRRIAIIEVMGRDSGYIALGSAYGQPDIILLPESPVVYSHLERRVRELYELQKHVVIVVGEGVVDEQGNQLGAVSKSTDPAGNVVFSGAAEHLKSMLVKSMGNEYFTSKRRNESADSAIFTRKLGHTQRGGRPILFDRFHAAQLGGKAVEVLAEGQNNMVVTLQCTQKQGFYVDSIHANRLRDQWGVIHPRQMHLSFYDAGRFQPSKLGIEYLLPIFTNAIGLDDMEDVRVELFHSGNLTQRYQSVNVDMQKRIRVLQ